MNKKYIRAAIIAGAVVIVGVAGIAFLNYLYGGPKPGSVSFENFSGKKQTMIVAGGCFWCVEADMEKVPGVLEAVSGYSQGDSQNPTYETYAAGGHIEVAKIIYDPTQVSYQGLLEYFIKHIDPTDGEGSFVDRGFEYSPAIYYETREEETIAKEVLASVEARGIFEKPLQVPVLPRETFWEAEAYHQDYYLENPLRYSYYRNASGRDDFIEKHWGDEAKQFPPAPANVSAEFSASWTSFEKPDEQTLKQRLTPLQYQITQLDATEKPFDNIYWNNEKPGIYVDIVSGEPLFSSINKFRSETGWPSFTKPLEPANVILRDDWSFLIQRTEVRSRYADSHLGHVFKDGPKTRETAGGAEPTGLRYCLNSAALRFIPSSQLKEEGYEQYAALFL